MALESEAVEAAVDAIMRVHVDRAAEIVSDLTNTIVTIDVGIDRLGANDAVTASIEMEKR